jgi:hypothetical protein
MTEDQSFTGDMQRQPSGGTQRRALSEDTRPPRQSQEEDMLRGKIDAGSRRHFLFRKYVCDAPLTRCEDMSQEATPPRNCQQEDMFGDVVLGLPSGQGDASKTPTKKSPPGKIGKKITSMISSMKPSRSQMQRLP